MSTLQFNELEWHDAVLLNLRVDRQSPGDDDRVEMEVGWPSGGPKQLITFSDCYYFSAAMNFGVLNEESILDGSATRESPLLDDIREKWGRLGADLCDLVEYRIETNTTNSLITVCAMTWSLN